MKYKKKINISRNILMFFFSKLVIFMKRRNKKIRFEVKKKKYILFFCPGMTGCMMANYKKIIQEQNIKRKRRNETKRIKPADILSKERKKSV